MGKKFPMSVYGDRDARANGQVRTRRAYKICPYLRTIAVTRREGRFLFGRSGIAIAQTPSATARRTSRSLSASVFLISTSRTAFAGLRGMVISVAKYNLNASL